jgi:hypothetical protein
VKEKESWDLKDNTQKIEAATKKKDEGNVWFKIGKYARASKRYGKVIISRYWCKITLCNCCISCPFHSKVFLLFYRL